MSELELGAQVPAWLWDYDATELRDWAQGVEAIGYGWVGVTDVLLASYTPSDQPTERGHHGPMQQHEPLTLLAYLAACTSRVMLTTSVLVLSQRQPALVAKQAAEVDVLSGGRLRLGVGMGESPAEYAGLGMPFVERGARLEEAVQVLRACWSQEPVTFAGRFTTLAGVSLLPKPVTPGGPPICFGGRAPAALRRAARLGDGWIAATRFSMDDATAAAAALAEALRAEGRDPASFSLQATMALSEDIAGLRTSLLAYRKAGFSRLGLHLPSFDPASALPVDAYLRQLEAVYREVWPGVVG